MPSYRPIPAQEGCTTWPLWYRVGDDGSVWSRRKVGRYGGVGQWRRLEPSIITADRGGTLKVHLIRDGIARQGLMVAVDVCVCRAFHGPQTIGARPVPLAGSRPGKLPGQQPALGPPRNTATGHRPAQGRPAARAQDGPGPSPQSHR